MPDPTDQHSSSADGYHPVVILGSGPAGFTAALYAARAELAPVVLEGNQPGGQLTITTEVENYPGFPEGILGPELMDLMRKQAQRFGAKVKFETATAVDLAKRPFAVTTDAGTTLRAGALIVATGASAKLLGIPSEDHLMGYGVSACATCDGFFFKDKEVVVVGGGDTAMEEATVPHPLRRQGHRDPPPRGAPRLEDHAGPRLRTTARSPGSGTAWSTRSWGAARGASKACACTTRRPAPTASTRPRASSSPSGTGRTPISSRASSRWTSWATSRSSTLRAQTNVEGVFACGDVMDPVYRQAVTAAGTGCVAAMDAERWLAEHYD